ncbi:MAG: hypothetical protein LBR73_09230 [Oscillospiraceae bacterium]|jgi:hypothetical protein|nr:hypothetical protein [Oscillospiraceae bacterium]
MKTSTLLPSRKSTFLPAEETVPTCAEKLLESASAALRAYPLPLPFRKKDCTCGCAGADGSFWLGAPNGLTWLRPNAPDKRDRVWFFSAPRDLPGSTVTAVAPTSRSEHIYDAVTVQTDKGSARIEIAELTGDEKANLLLEESRRTVDRRGMMSGKGLQEPRALDKPLPYHECDNDGDFGCGFAIAEILHYATLKRELGENHPETRRIRAIATRTAEAMLLLMWIPCRGDGFVARTYLTPDEPIPDGWFFRKMGDGTSEVVDTPRAVRAGRAGLRIPCPEQVPARLAKLYTDLGYTEKGLVYKGDTSSDETTLHFAHLWFVQKHLAEGDPELGALAYNRLQALTRHIITHGFEMHDAFGKPTTWAKWSPAYFTWPSFGWADAPNNAAEILMYLRVAMDVAAERGDAVFRLEAEEAYTYLLSKGYARLTTLHHDRFIQTAAIEGLDLVEHIMFGDHMLATMAFWLLITLEPEEDLKAVYREGFASWRSSIGREFNPGYDFPYILATGADTGVDYTYWFARSPLSRLTADADIESRRDLARRKYKGGYIETAHLLPDDERFIAKYDRNPRRWQGSRGECFCESCYVYTFAWWIGRYYGIIEN